MTAAGILGRIPLLAKWSGRMIQIKTPHEIELMRASGLVTAGALEAVRAAVRPRVSTGELAAGDNISIDCGAILNGWHSDSAITVTVGEPSAEDAALLEVTERSMWAGLAKALAGGRLTDISHAVEETITAERHPYGIVDHYGGDRLRPPKK